MRIDRVVTNADVRIISGCRDERESADASVVSSFGLPDSEGRASGAYTSTLLHILYANHERTNDDLTFAQVLSRMSRNCFERKGFFHLPQLSCSKNLDMNTRFNIVPESHGQGARRAVLIGINYVGHETGELRCCHYDVLRVKEYIMDVHGFKEENITLLLDDGVHHEPSLQNILSAYYNVARASEAGDSIFCHYSGHGGSYDETLIPLDYERSGLILDDDIYESLISPLKKDVTLTGFFDCCHSRTVLDLPFKFVADGISTQMRYEQGADLGKKLINLNVSDGQACIRKFLDFLFLQVALTVRHLRAGIRNSCELLINYRKEVVDSFLYGYLLLSTWRLLVAVILFVYDEEARKILIKKYN